MLVLQRGLGEKIMIGDDIEVVVLSVNGNQVRLGIRAPDGVEVHREEVYLRILKEKVRKIDGKETTEGDVSH